MISAAVLTSMDAACRPARSCVDLYCLREKGEMKRGGLEGAATEVDTDTIGLLLGTLDDGDETDDILA